jgi:hypothetical protein
VIPVNLSALGVVWYCHLDQVEGLVTAIGWDDGACPEHGRSGWLLLPDVGAPPPPADHIAERWLNKQETPRTGIQGASTNATDLESARGRYKESA